VVIHHIKVDPIGPRFENDLYLIAQFGKVGREDRGGNPEVLWFDEWVGWKMWVGGVMGAA
jgi:hypothetical protein